MPYTKFSLPKTRLNALDRRNRQVRHPYCHVCLVKGRKWYNDGNDNHYLVLKNGDYHECSGVSREPLKVIKTPNKNENNDIDANNIDMQKIYARIDSYIQSKTTKTHNMVIKKANNQKVTIDGYPHKTQELLTNVLNQRVHVMLVGPAGGGKSSAAETAAKIMEVPYYEASMGPATSQWDLMGYRSPDGKYVSGIMRPAFENGGVLMLDEMDNANPSVLTSLNTALANGHANFPDKRVEAHEDFVVVAAGNTYGRGADRMYVGRSQLDAASLDRFAVIDWDYDEDAELQWAGEDKKRWVKYVQKVRHVIEKNNMRYVISPRASIIGAKLLRAGMSVSQVSEMILFKGMNVSDRQRIEPSAKY